MKRYTSIFKSLKTNHWFRGFSIGFVISIIVTLSAFLGHFRIFETPFTSALQKINDKKSNDIVLVFITENEYKSGFHGISPLSIKRLANVVNALVKLKAKAICLDIDLSDKAEDDFYFLSSIENAALKKIPVVVPSILKKNTVGVPIQKLLETHPYLPGKYKDGTALYHSRLPKNIAEKTMHGGAVFQLDRDGVFRNGNAFYHIEQNGLKKVRPSLPLSIAASYFGITPKKLQQSLDEREHHNIKLLISPNQPGRLEHINIHYGANGKITPNFIGNYEKFNRIIDLENILLVNKDDFPIGSTIIQNKIVIVGGVYDSNDFYRTPVGRMSGMEILANIAQSIINNDLITHLNFWKAFVLEVLLGALVALFFILFSYKKAFFICGISAVPLIIGSSILAFSSIHYWFDFIPTIAGVLAHGIISRHETKTHNSNEV